MPRRDYHTFTPRQRSVLGSLRAAPPDGFNTGLLAYETGLTFKQAEITAEGLRKRGLVILFTYRGGAQVWRIAPDPNAGRAEFLTPPGSSRP